MEAIEAVEYILEDDGSRLGLILALLAFLTGLYQYRQGQRWTAIEFGSAEIKEFLADRDVRNAMMLLDYHEAPITFV